MRNIQYQAVAFNQAYLIIELSVKSREYSISKCFVTYKTISPFQSIFVNNFILVNAYLILDVYLIPQSNIDQHSANFAVLADFPETSFLSTKTYTCFLKLK